MTRASTVAGLAVASLAAFPACGASATAEPVPVRVAVGFPSSQAAIVSDSLEILAFGSTASCAELVAARRAGRPLPDALASVTTTPCALGTGASLDLDQSEAYSFLVVARATEKDLFLGCARQSSLGDVKPTQVDLAYANNEFTISTIEKLAPGSTTKCARLSDKCSNACR
jgi:hypothetical protein